jgi:hypothetical protein
MITVSVMGFLLQLQRNCMAVMEESRKCINRDFDSLVSVHVFGLQDISSVLVPLYNVSLNHNGALCSSFAGCNFF